jgi:hypothetical protein
MSEYGVLPDPGAVDPGDLLDYLLAGGDWYLTDSERTLDPRQATHALAMTAFPRSPWFAQVVRQRLFPEHLLARRMEMFTLALLGHIGATANWHRIAREWLFGEEPVTELGRLEAAFYGW